MEMKDHQFDWDDIDVGNSTLNDSQNFFAETHRNHEQHYAGKENLYGNVVQGELPNNAVIITNEDSEDKENNQHFGMNCIECSNSKKANSLATSTQSFANIEMNVVKHSPLKIMDELHIKEKKLDNNYNHQNQNTDKDNSHEQQHLNTVEEELDSDVVAAVTHQNENFEEKQNNQKWIDCDNGLIERETSLVTSPQISGNVVKNIAQHLPSPITAEMYIREEKFENNQNHPDQSAETDNLYEQDHMSTVQEEFAKATITEKNIDNEQNNVEFRNNLDSSRITQTPTSSISVKCGTTKLPHLQTVEWSQKKTIVIKSSGAIKKAATSSGPATPKAYKINEIYKKKREALERQREEEERKKREFHAKPMPDLNGFIKKLQNRQVVHYITLPVTPKVLKRSRKEDEKCKRKVETTVQTKELLKNSAQPPTVLHEKPFACVKKPVTIEQKPFKLHLLERLEKRKQYDEAIQKALDDKRKQEEEERKRQEAECVKELRKATTFKARPNPFKK